MQFSIAADVGNAQINLGKSSSNDFKIGNVCDLNVDYCNTLKKWNHTNVQQITNKMKKKKISFFRKVFSRIACIHLAGFSHSKAFREKETII